MLTAIYCNSGNLGSGFFDAFTAIYCNFGNFGSGFLGRTTAKKYVFLFLGRYFYFQYRSSSLLISGKVEITADNTVKKALPISLKTGLSAGNTVKKALPISLKIGLSAGNTVKKALPIRNWGRVHVELSIMYPGRLSH